MRLIEYIEGSGESLQHWINEVKRREYSPGKNIAPHDIMVHEYTTGMTRQSAARKLGFNLIAAKKVEVMNGIDAARNILNRCFFDEKKCALGIKALDNYKKEWDERLCCWRSQPLHNWASHGADGFRTLATGLSFVTNSRSLLDEQKEVQQQQQYIQNRFGRISNF